MMQTTWFALWGLLLAASFVLGSATLIWFNHVNRPILLVLPLLEIVALLMTRRYLRKASFQRARLASALTVAALTLWAVAGLFPDLVPSSLDAAYSLTAFNSATNRAAVGVAGAVAVVAAPIIFACQWRASRR